jgi:UDP-GlcNAc:undecaprenyl-phosphate GlcNAc-1-phosphate transferase
MNSINMLDNMDGISTTVSIGIIASALLLLILQANLDTAYLFILIGVLAALLGFLWYNWNPSRMYMGDTGSQFLGVFLAAISINFFWGYRFDGGGEFQLQQFLPPLIVFTVPFLDTGTVIIRRLLRNQSPFVGGKDHITHHLGYLGLSDRGVALVIASISIISVLVFWWMHTKMVAWKPLDSIIIIGYFLFLFGGINVLYQKGKKRQSLIDDQED